MAKGDAVEQAQQKRKISGLFTQIAKRYDTVNRIISLGRDQHWRRRALKQVGIPQGARVLDVASGTGDLAIMVRKRYAVKQIIGTDLTPAMLRIAQRKVIDSNLPLAVSDGLALAFVDGHFDVVMSSFMMRNVPDVGQALREQYRVLESGGRMLCLEISWPRTFPMNVLFRLYFFGFPQLVGTLLSRQREAYRYLPRSVERFMTPEEMRAEIQAAGFVDIETNLMMFGTVALYTATKRDDTR